MDTLSHLLRCDGRTPRAAFVRNLLLLAAGKAAIDLQAMALRPDLFTSWSWGRSWTDPFVLIVPWLRGEAPSLVCCTAFLFFAALVWNSVHRLRHAGRDARLALLVVVPWVNVIAVAALCIAPRQRRRSVFDLP